MKPHTHHCFSTSTLVRLPNRVMFGFTLTTEFTSKDVTVLNPTYSEGRSHFTRQGIFEFC
ncbi:MAG TPA: hypothetical protein V6D11_00645 [Waterburya sp.]